VRSAAGEGLPRPLLHPSPLPRPSLADRPVLFGESSVSRKKSVVVLVAPVLNLRRKLAKLMGPILLSSYTEIII